MKYAPRMLKKTIKKNASDMVTTTSCLLGGGSGRKVLERSERRERNMETYCTSLDIGGDCQALWGLATTRFRSRCPWYSL